MKLTVIQSVLRSLCVAGMLIGSGHTSAQTQISPPTPRNAAEGNQTNLVMATPFAITDTVGGSLLLPDGSVIRTVWPAAVEVTTIKLNPKWVNEPVTPRCEPAVYSLARVMPDGKELWAKSYIFKSKMVVVCYADVWGYNVRSAMREAVAPGFYRRPFDGHFFIGEPADPKKIEVAVATGNTVGAVPKNLRVIDAYQLANIKRGIYDALEAKFPDPDIPADVANKVLLRAFGLQRTRAELSRNQLLETRLEKALFPSR